MEDLRDERKKLMDDAFMASNHLLCFTASTPGLFKSQTPGMQEEIWKTLAPLLEKAEQDLTDWRRRLEKEFKSTKRSPNEIDVFLYRLKLDLKKAQKNSGQGSRAWGRAFPLALNWGERGWKGSEKEWH